MIFLLLSRFLQPLTLAVGLLKLSVGQYFEIVG